MRLIRKVLKQWPRRQYKPLSLRQRLFLKLLLYLKHPWLPRL